MRCRRCGKEAGDTDKFCAECGLFLRDAHVDERLMLAMVHEKGGDHKQARRELERLTAAEPEHALANHLLGTMYFHQGLLDLAIQSYGRALEAEPGFIECAYDQGVAYYHRGNMSESARWFQRIWLVLYRPWLWFPLRCLEFPSRLLFPGACQKLYWLGNLRSSALSFLPIVCRNSGKLYIPQSLTGHCSYSGEPSFLLCQPVQ